tara:strand:- start:755 stop:1138 length:384 start_codon:yes stop_codon:yes gene_type:complete
LAAASAGKQSAFDGQSAADLYTHGIECSRHRVEVRELASAVSVLPARKSREGLRLRSAADSDARVDCQGTDLSANEILCVVDTLPTTRAKHGLVTHVVHVPRAMVNGFADLGCINSVADTNDHSDPA